MPVNIPGTSANIHPGSVAVDAAGNLFFSDASGVVLRLDAKMGVVTVVAGNGTAGFSGDNGLATNAQLNGPNGVAVDSAGNLYIADSGNNRVRKVSNGVISTVAGNGTQGYGGDNGPATWASLYGPAGVAVDANGNLFIADWGNNRMRKVSGGVITTIAGNGIQGLTGDNGPATSAQLEFPEGVAVDTAGNVYIAVAWGNVIRKVSNGIITTVAGTGTPDYGGDNGPATSAALLYPTGVAVDAAGNLYIADFYNNRVREVSGGIITTVAGYGGDCCILGDGRLATSAQLHNPSDVAVDSTGNLYIADGGDARVRKVSNGLITTMAGGGPPLGSKSLATSAQLLYPQGVAVDTTGNVYMADSTDALIRKVSSGIITTVAGTGTPGYSGDGGPAISAQLSYPIAVAADAGGSLYIADLTRIRRVSSGVITTVAGNSFVGYSGDTGPATSAMLFSPQGVAVDAAGTVYIADSGNNRIRRVSNGVITTVAGNGTSGYNGDNIPATSATLSGPYGVAVDAAGNLYIADFGNCRIRKVSNGIITTVAGNGLPGYGGDNGAATNASLNGPYGVAVDAAGTVYIADSGNNRIRIVSGGVIATIAGTGVEAFSGDGGPADKADLVWPWAVAVDGSNSVYIVDASTNRIRILTPGTPPSITPGGIVPNDSTVSAIQSGSWISIFGTDLASGTSLWNADFPKTLGGTSVTVDNRPAYLWYVSPQQINLQVPDDSTTGVVEVVVTTASGTASSTVTLATYSPSFSLLGDGKHVAAEIVTPDGSGAYGGGTYDLVGPSNTFSYNTRPVKAGETLVLYGVGFGPTTPTVLAGQAYSGASRTNSPVTVTIGGVSASVAFAGISEAGLYQLNVTVPTNTGSGDQALQATVNGVQTPLGPVVTVQLQ